MREAVELNVTEVSTPLGLVTILADEQAVLATGFDGVLSVPDELFAHATRERSSLLDAAAAQLAEYFTGQRMTFDLPLNAKRLHGFRASVEAELVRIPYGSTRTYAQVALDLGNPGASRAVGNACARNPLPVLLPCHRVVKTGGALGGYVGGVERKRALIELEGGR